MKKRTEREREKEREIGEIGEIGERGERERERVCVYVCVRERGNESAQ